MRLGAACTAMLLSLVNCCAATVVVGSGFEGAFASNGVAEGFVADSYSNWGDYDIVYARETANPHSGAACQKITINRIGYISPQRRSWIGHGAAQLRAAQPVPLRKGVIYRVRAWLRASEPIEVTVQIRQAGRPWWSYYDQRLMADETWRKVEYVFTSGVDDSTALFIIKFAQLGTVWVDDAMVEELTPEEAAQGVPPPQEGNLLQNGDFDLGLANWLGAVDWDNTGAPIFEVEKTGEEYRLKMTPAGKPMAAVSDVVALTPGWPVRATCRVRAARPVKITFGVYTMGAQHAMWPFCTTEATVGPDEQRLEVSSDVPYMPFGPYGFIRIIVDEPVVTWVDDVQLRQDGEDAGGDPPRAAIISTKHPLGLYSEPEKPVLRLMASVPAMARVTGFSWRVADFWGKTVLAGSWKPGAGRHEKTIPGANLARGWYRADVSWKWQGRLLSNEATFCLLPPAERKADPEKSAFGGHFMYGPAHLALARAVGVRWVRTWPPMFTCWNVVEPEKGRLVWHDEATQAYAERAGLRIFGMIEQAPDWAAKEEDPKAAWARYAETVVGHYKDRIRVWEIFNEPDLRYWVSRPDG
ncbi:MAG: carbohydrate binding domain-containing protein, partial [Armatimonadetes bacterium]|nr:carbohydrate binding domain-containing protein [Armatimonadota bacterium]